MGLERSPTLSARTEPCAVFVVGPSSSGKTTLCNALAKNLQLESELFVKEVARAVMKNHGFSRNDTHTYEMQSAILMAQLQAEQYALSHGTRRTDILFLSDRSAIDPIVYAATSGSEEAAHITQKLVETPLFQDILPFYRRSLFVVLHPVPEWIVDDGIRSLQDPLNYNTQLCGTLAELGIPFTEITRDMRSLEERVSLVKLHLLAREPVHG